jgi:hypothetical protein
MRTNDENGARHEAAPHPARLPAWQARLLAKKGKRRRSWTPWPPAVLERNAEVSADRANFDAVNQAARANMELPRTPGVRMEAGVP